MEREVERLGAELASTRQVSDDDNDSGDGGDGDCDTGDDGGGDGGDRDGDDGDDGGGDDEGNDGDDDDDLQTILRMHEREEKMKERLMDLRLKSEEQVAVLRYIYGQSLIEILIQIILNFSQQPFLSQISITSSSTSAVYLSVKGRSGTPGSPRGAGQGSRSSFYSFSQL